jgi:hypothetical protein
MATILTNGNAAGTEPVPEQLVGTNAADAIAYCTRAAELLRSQASSMKSLAVTLEAEAEALAVDIEKRAERFATMVELFSKVVSQVRSTFEQERARLDGSEIVERVDPHGHD